MLKQEWVLCVMRANIHYNSLLQEQESNSSLFCDALTIVKSPTPAPYALHYFVTGNLKKSSEENVK